MFLGLYISLPYFYCTLTSQYDKLFVLKSIEANYKALNFINSHKERNHEVADIIPVRMIEHHKNRQSSYSGQQADFFGDSFSQSKRRLKSCSQPQEGVVSFTSHKDFLSIDRHLSVRGVEIEELNSSLLEGVELCSNSVDLSNLSVIIETPNRPFLAKKSFSPSLNFTNQSFYAKSQPKSKYESISTIGHWNQRRKKYYCLD